MNLADSKLRFEQDGFLRVENLFSRGRLLELERELKQYHETIVPGLPAGDVVYETDPATGQRTGVRNLWRMEKYSPYFDEFAHQPQILELVGTLVNGEPVLMAVELFAKPARIGGAVPYHQDNGYFNLTPPDALTFWLALDASTVENGCVYYARGKEPQRPAASRDPHGFQRCPLHGEHRGHGNIPGCGEGPSGKRRTSKSQCDRLRVGWVGSLRPSTPWVVHERAPEK